MWLNEELEPEEAFARSPPRIARFRVWLRATVNALDEYVDTPQFAT